MKAEMIIIHAKQLPLLQQLGHSLTTTAIIYRLSYTLLLLHEHI